MKTEQNTKKKEILVLCDSPAGVTGFSNVARHILRDVFSTGKYNITVVGINYDGEGYDNKAIPYKIIPATSGLIERYHDVYGRQRALDMLMTGNFDIFFTIQDMAVIESFSRELKIAKEKKGFKAIIYTPVDSALDTVPHWVTKVIPIFDYPVAYTEFAKKEMSKFIDVSRVRVCLHGVDTTEFYPVSKTPNKMMILKDFFGMNLTDAQAEKKFIILNVNRNQTRKDYLRCFQVVKEYQKQYPEDDVLFVCVAQIRDQGGDLVKIAKQVGLEYGRDWVTPIQYSAAMGFPVEVLNLWYNMADVVFSATLGEGFGLSSIEGMATGVPVVFPNNTSLPEILGNGERGILVASGIDGDYLSFGAMDSSLVRPRISLYDAVASLKAAKTMGRKCERVEKALAWAKTMDWKNVDKFWVDLFAEASGE